MCNTRWVLRLSSDGHEAGYLHCWRCWQRLLFFRRLASHSSRISETKHNEKIKNLGLSRFFHPKGTILFYDCQKYWIWAAAAFWRINFLLYQTNGHTTFHHIGNTIQHNTIRCNTRRCTIHYSIIQYNRIQYNEIRCSAMQFTLRVVFGFNL